MHIESKINDNNNLVPENTILVVTESDEFDQLALDIIQPMKGQVKRDWFIKHAYYCLPLTIGNQYGFAIRSMYDFTAIWNGGNSPLDLIINVDNKNNPNKQTISSHFGMGVITIQNRFHFRTPLGINLITLNPPNTFIPNLQNMTGVIETDNLRRDFTLNLKVTSPNVLVSVKAGDLIGCVLPVPRFSVENYDFKVAKEVLPQAVIDAERAAGHAFAVERSGPDRSKPNGNGRRYANGVDIYNNEFYQHQKNMGSDIE
jgi:hypothetical protein